jgi:tetratricopeptide (TPR) repeat protein
LAPDEPNPYDTRGDIYASNGRIDQAIESYRKALEIRPDFESSLVNLGNMYLFKREYARAESLYHKLCAGIGKSGRSEGRLRLATIAAYQGKFDEALETLDAGIKADRMDRTEIWLAEKYQLKSEIYFERNAPAKAMEALERSDEVTRRLDDPEFAIQLSYLRVLHLAENGDIAGAEDVAETMRRHFEGKDGRGMSYYWFAAGCVERAKGNLGAAAADFEKGTEPLLWFLARYMLGSTYYEAGQLGEAVAEFEKAVAAHREDRPNRPIQAVKVYYMLGLAYEQSGWKNKAIENYEEFLEIWKDADPGLPEIEDARQRLARLK